MLVFVAERTGTIRLCHADQRYPLQVWPVMVVGLMEVYCRVWIGAV